MTINQVQDEIIEDFEIFGEDREEKLLYIIDLGNKLKEISEEDRIDTHTIKGCQSKVWLISSFKNDKIFFQADSNTVITKGLISLLVRVFSERTPDEILETNLYFIDKIGMGSLIGSQRSNGLVAMVKQIKMYALAYKTKMQKS